MKIVYCLLSIFFFLIIAVLSSGSNYSTPFSSPSWLTASPVLLPGNQIAPAEAKFIANLSGQAEKDVTYKWDFGDGTSSTELNPSHTFLNGGDYQATFRVWLDYQLVFESTLFVNILHNPEFPRIQIINAPTETEDVEAEISGKILVPRNTKLESVIWDQINLNQAGEINLPKSDGYFFVAIPLKPGKNEVLFTAIDSMGRIDTEKVIITRNLDSPLISNIRHFGNEVTLFSKFEIEFDVLTTAENVFFEYDPLPPPGVAPHSGVTVEAIIQTPEGKTLVQPAYYSRPAENVGTQFMPAMVESGATGSWFVRFSPQVIGEYHVTLSAKDQSGQTQISAGSFTAVETIKPGFIGVCEQDARYFCFSNGDVFYPSGPILSEDISTYAGSGINFTRKWLAPYGAYSTNFSRWVSSSRQMGNEGVEAALTSEFHYPSSELSHKMDAKMGDRLWLGWIEGDKFPYRFDAGSNYQIKLRFSTRNMSGPADPSRPYGLMLINHQWIEDPSVFRWETYPSLIPVTKSDTDWHTILAIYRPTNTSAPFLSFILSNMISGEAFIDEFSIRKVERNGDLGGEMVFNSKADMHTYVESKAAAYIDQLIINGESEGVYFKFVVHDKNDWIQNHLLENGEFNDIGDGYFQATDTKANWLLRQWWRYAIARWGYSTSIHSWELLNEGPPDNQGHYALAQQFGKFMHTLDTHPHLTTTSFWYGWEGKFWKNSRLYPDIDYADYHLYVTEIEDFENIPLWKQNMENDIYINPPGKPIILGELGFFYPGEQNYDVVREASPQVLWYRDLVWSQLSANTIFTPTYWWNDHLENSNYLSIAKAFNAFVSDIPFAQKKFSELPVKTSVTQWSVIAQKSLDNDFAFAWFHNSRPTLRSPIFSSQSRTMHAILLLNPASKYLIDWYDTEDGLLLYSEIISTDSQGRLDLYFSKDNPDLALKIRKQ
jgi:hypothetical protein